MAPDRRADLGGKMSWLLISTLIAGFSSFAWVQASKGEAKADLAQAGVNENKIKIAVLEANLVSINVRLDEIKTLIKAIK